LSDFFFLLKLLYALQARRRWWALLVIIDFRLCRSRKVRANGETKHEGIAAFIAGFNAHVVAKIVFQAVVPARILRYGDGGWLVSVIVAVVLHFDTERVPRRLILETSEPRGVAFKPFVDFESTATTAVPAGSATELVGELTE